MRRSYLALDLGAESGRAMLGHLAQHRLELHEVHRFPNVPVQLPNGLYWDTLRLFHEICEGIRAGGQLAEEIDGIGVDTWGVDFALLDSQGHLLDNPRHYRDRRNVGLEAQVVARIGREEIFRQSGIQFMEINSLYQLYAIQQGAPHLLRSADLLLFMPDLFSCFLTGTAVCERTIASTSQFYNPVSRRFATDMLRKLNIQASFLPELVDPGTELGSVLPYVSNLCGIRSETPVYAVGSHDTASAVAAVPANPSADWCFISSGTWSLMGCELEAPLINVDSLKANFTNEAGVENRTRFLQNIPGLWVLQECRRAWKHAGQEFGYAELMERAREARSSKTVLNLDLFTSPGNYPKLIREFCLQTDQEYIDDPGFVAKVILFSLAQRYLQVLGVLQYLTGKYFEVIYIVGGGSRNRLLNQLTADVTGRRVIAGPAEATAAGNALTQAMGTGAIRSLEELRAVIRHSFEIEEFVPAS